MYYSELDQNWEAIQKEFQNVCILRREGRDDEAMRHMEQKLSPLLADWTRENHEEGFQKRQRLEDMFEKEINRVEDAWLTQSLLNERLLQPFLKDLRSMLAAVQDGVSGKLSEMNQFTQTAAQSPTIVDFEAALEPLRKEICELKTELAQRQVKAESSDLIDQFKALLDERDEIDRAQEDSLMAAAYRSTQETVGEFKQFFKQQHHAIIDKVEEQACQLSEGYNQLASALETIYNELEKKSSQTLPDEIIATLQKLPGKITPEIVANNDTVLQVGKAIRTELKELRKNLSGLNKMPEKQPDEERKRFSTSDPFVHYTISKAIGNNQSDAVKRR